MNSPALASHAAGNATAAPGSVAARVIPEVPLWLLALFTLSGSLAMHIFVPALPTAAADFGASNSALQATIGIYIFGLAFGQLVYGPLSDRFGRRTMMMIGLVLYTVAGIGASLAPTVHALIVARLFQALGGCAGLVLGRAIVRDTSGPTDSARRLALMNLMMTIGPGFAPIVGGLMATVFGWRSIFYLLATIGAAGLLLAWRRLPETSNRNHQSSMADLGRNYRDLLRSRTFVGLAIGGGCATTSMYAYIASAPFIFEHQLGRPTHEVGIYLGIAMAGAAIGSLVTSRLITRIALPRLMVGANLVSVIAAIVMLVAIALGFMSVPLIVVSTFLFTLGVGIASPAALTQAVSLNPHVIGSASGLYGFTQMAVGGICTSVVGFGSDPSLSMALVLSAAGLLAQFMFWLALHR
ncbi:multidrug effflux MFS transporter [soil metagenome]